MSEPPATPTSGGAGRYAVPARVHRVEETIRGSRFLTALARAPDAEAAQAFIQSCRDAFLDATHHCWAFVAGPPGSTAHIGMSDDGEPHGTAGRPMLTSLLHSGVGDVVAVCTRWYGGTKLGTGGLARAYSGGVTLALESLPTVEKVARTAVEITVGYPDVDALQRLVREHDVAVDSDVYGADVRYRGRVPEDRMNAFRRELRDATRGEGRIEELPPG